MDSQSLFCIPVSRTQYSGYQKQNFLRFWNPIEAQIFWIPLHKARCSFDEDADNDRSYVICVIDN